MLRIAQITDCHILAQAGQRLYGIDTEATLLAVLDRLRRWGPSLVLATGDLADDGQPASYRRLRTHLRALGCPVWVVPGNHDASAAMRAHLLGDEIRWASPQRLGGWQLIGLDTLLPGAAGGRLDPSALADLDRWLGPGPVLIYLHHPPVPVGNPLFDAMGLAEPAGLLARLQAHDGPSVITCGHVHQAFDQQLGNIRVLTSPSTCSQALPGTDGFVADALGPGFRWFELDGSQIRTGVDRVPCSAHQIGPGLAGPT